MGYMRYNLSENIATIPSIVAQFTVYTNPNNLLYLLNTLKNNNIKISGFNMCEINNKSVFKFIVDTSSNQVASDINITRNILQHHRFNYNESKVVRVYFKDMSSFISQYNSLIKGIKIYNFYISDDGYIIYETCCPVKTLNTLNQLN